MSSVAHSGKRNCFRETAAADSVFQQQNFMGWNLAASNWLLPPESRN